MLFLNESVKEDGASVYTVNKYYFAYNKSIVQLILIF